MNYRVRLTRAAKEDLQRLEDFLLEKALDTGDFGVVERALAGIHRQLRLLASKPLTCRKAGGDHDDRELVVAFGRSGYVALLHVLADGEVVVGAVRDQREDDHH